MLNEKKKDMEYHNNDQRVLTNEHGAFERFIDECGGSSRDDQFGRAADLSAAVLGGDSDQSGHVRNAARNVHLERVVLLHLFKSHSFTFL